MWILTPIGFFSIVQKPDDAEDDTLTIRSRVKSDLEMLKVSVLPSLSPIKESMSTDYRYRAKADRKAVADAMSTIINRLEYSNFKSQVANKQGSKREKLYHKVWDVLYSMQGNSQYEVSVPFAFQVPRADAYGGILINIHGNILLREPKNHFGGYVWTWAKGKPDKGEQPHQTALREVFEETGYKANIVGTLPKAYGGTTSSTSFFVMTPDGDQEKFTSETSSTRWVSFDEASDLIKKTTNAVGRTRDLIILDAIKIFWGTHTTEIKKNLNTALHMEQSSLRIIKMVSALHQMGFQFLRIMPYEYPLAHRIEIRPKSRISKHNGAFSPLSSWEEERFGLWAGYTSASERKCFDWDDAENNTPQELAKKFIKRYPELANAGFGRDWEYAGWLLELIGELERKGGLPIVIAERLEAKPYSQTSLAICEYGCDWQVRYDFPLPPPGDIDDDINEHSGVAGCENTRFVGAQ